MLDLWKINDCNGCIFSGTEEEMKNKFDEITNGEEDIEWNGDLELVEVHSIFR